MCHLALIAILYEWFIFKNINGEWCLHSGMFMSPLVTGSFGWSVSTMRLQFESVARFQSNTTRRSTQWRAKGEMSTCHHCPDCHMMYPNKFNVYTCKSPSSTIHNHLTIYHSYYSHIVIPWTGISRNSILGHNWNAIIAKKSIHWNCKQIIFSLYQNFTIKLFWENLYHPSVFFYNQSSPPPFNLSFITLLQCRKIIILGTSTDELSKSFNLFKSPIQKKH